MKKEINALSYRYYFIPVFIISLSGLVNSIYLSYSHYRNYNDISYISFCAISKAINCDTVSQSSYSIFMNIPVPFWGIIGYALLFFIIAISGTVRAEKRRGWPLIFIISGCFTAYSLVLAFISGYYIKSYCIMCILSYAINIALLFYSWIIRSRFDTDGIFRGLINDLKFFMKIKIARIVFFIIIVSPVAMWLFMPQYWLLKPLSIEESGIDSGMTDDGHPWIGATKPKLTITEFSDYRCFQCKKAHFFMRQLVAAHPDKLRLVHRHYPMDSRFNNVIITAPFHEGSGELALIAVYAAHKGNFWKVNDILFNLEIGDEGGINTARISELIGFSRAEVYFAIKNKTVRQILNNDILVGMKLEIMATPAFVIEGKVYIGELPFETIEKAVNEE
ncbi:vitamin K epoxide reductase/DsbA family protein [Desulforegula conservatrix]|uniref:vitamin K epoxide reductase/DsbA family protein n=1 Tax=Desulforegula conservatrix TaxID=153026 RepID=UPI00040BAC05|nr:vitamin K epoxide reductase family protein [Desulforegula conservatrix]